MPRALIINADDFGYDPAVTRGIAESMRQGIVNSTTLMVNTPHSEDAAKQAQGLSIGLHFNLARHPPLSPQFPRALLAGGELSEARAEEIPAQAARAEALAQLERLSALLGRPATHVDVHKHLHRHPQVLAGLAAAAKERSLPVRSIDVPMRAYLRGQGVATNDHFIGDAGAESYWTMDQLRAQLTALPKEGVVELMCHPGYAPTTLKSGYSIQREGELATFLNPEAAALVKRLGIRLETFAAAR